MLRTVLRVEGRRVERRRVGKAVRERRRRKEPSRARQLRKLGRKVRRHNRLLLLKPKLGPPLPHLSPPHPYRRSRHRNLPGNLAYLKLKLMFNPFRLPPTSLP
jgi:hypothetical protein